MSFETAARLIGGQGIRITQPGSLNDVFENPARNPNNKETDLVTKVSSHLSRNNIAITSYSETPLNLLMWSHYADEYKGVVIGFNAQHSFFKNLYRVRYVEKILNESFQPHIDILQKGNVWIYEKEWRQLWNKPQRHKSEFQPDNDYVGHDFYYDDENDNTIYLRHFPIEIISEIIYGPRFYENETIGRYISKNYFGNKVTDVDSLNLYLQENHPNIKLNVASPSKTKYELKLFTL